MIPYEMGRDLFEAATGDKRFVELSGLHNSSNYLENDNYNSELRSFLGLPRVADRDPGTAPEQID
jgi:hypothetical protein